VDPRTGALVPGGTVAQTRQVMQNLQTVLRGAGTSLDHAVMARIYLTNSTTMPRSTRSTRATSPRGGCRPHHRGRDRARDGGAVEIDLIVRL